jgi:DNA repair exonuclease SbcCD ATPase subunit
VHTSFPQFPQFPDARPAGATRIFVDKRKAWREQEQQLIEKWNSAAQRYRDIMARIAREDPFAAPDGPSEEMMSQAAAVRAEIEALRKKVARLKAEFNSGKRY